MIHFSIVVLYMYRVS